MAAKNSSGVKKIILLEDEEILGGIYKKNLEAAGYDVIWVRTTEETEKVAKSFKADVALLDHGISGEDKTGIDTIASLKKDLPNLKIVILSNYSQFQLEQKANKAGAVDYLIKIDTPPDVLVNYVNKLLN